MVPIRIVRLRCNHLIIRCDFLLSFIPFLIDTGMLPIDKPHSDEIFLSTEERELIDGILNKAKVVIGKQRGYLSANIDFSENDEIMEFLDKVSPTKKQPQQDFDEEIETSLVENLEERMMNEDISASMNTINLENESSCTSSNNNTSADEGKKAYSVPSSFQEDENNVVNGSSHLKKDQMSSEVDKDAAKLINNANQDENDNIRAPNNQDDDKTQSTDNQVKGEEEQREERCPIVWDWTRLYASDLHTVTWESKMLSSLCHIVENMAIEVSSQATKAALQFSVIGAIISAVALPSALLTASKLIDDPYQIVVIRADEAGKELAKCLLLSDERRPGRC